MPKMCFLSYLLTEEQKSAGAIGLDGDKLELPDCRQ